MNNNGGVISSAQLWIGDQISLKKEAIAFFKQLWCTKNQCNQCVTCQQIETNQHPHIMWLCPEQGYTMDMIHLMQETMNVQQTYNTRYFFVLEKADFLTVSCANALLKSLEEPSQGCYFLLLAQRKGVFLPTVLSRCCIRYVYEKNESVAHQKLFNFFTQNALYAPILFLRELESAKLHEQDNIELLDRLMNYWQAVSHAALLSNNDQSYNDAREKFELLCAAAALPAMSGSSAIFWKDIFLQWHKEKGA